MPDSLSSQRLIGGLGLLASTAGLPVILMSLGQMPILWLVVYSVLLVCGLLLVWRNPTLSDRPGLLVAGALLAALVLEMVWEAAIDAPGFDSWPLMTAAKALTWLMVLGAVGVELGLSWRRGFWRTSIGRDVFIILAVGIAIRILTAVSWRYHIEEDGLGYVMLAQSFVDLSLQSNMQYSFFQFLLSFVLRSTQYLGPWTEATHLAIFLTLSLIVPLTSYDILRRARGRWSGVAGGVVAAVALPQIIWAHHSWSEGTDIILIMLALWAVSLALDPDYPRPGRAFVLAGITMGMLGLMRPPMLLLALIFGLVILLTPHLRRRWLRWGMALGIPFVLIVGGWTLFIHYPSTHKLSPAPYTGWNLLLSAMIKGLPIEAGNGPATAELIRLGAVHTPLDDEPLSVEEFFTMIGNPAISGTPENYTWYLAQPPAPEADLTRLNDFPIFEWLYYLGIDRADQLMKTAFQETLQGRQGYYVLGIFIDMFRMYDPGWNGMFKNWYPEENSMTWGQRGPLGWQRATQDTLAIINLQDIWLWRPGVRFLSIITPLLRNIPSWFTYLVLGWTLLLSHVWPTGPSQNWQRRQPILWAGLVLISDITWAATTLPGFRRHVLTDAVWVLCLVWMCADISSVRYITQERRINQKSPVRSEKVE